MLARNFIVTLVLACISLVAGAQTVLNLPFNNENFPQYDAYIRKYAPTDSALRVLQVIFQNNLNSGRAAAARKAVLLYGPLFPTNRAMFARELETAGQYMLEQSATQDQSAFYDEFIRDSSPSDDAFLAVQRQADRYINARLWDSAVSVFKHYEPYFETEYDKFETIISILKAPMEGLRITNLGPGINTKGDEWDPNPTPDGRYLYFSSSGRPDSYGGSDVYFSDLKEGSWQLPRNVGRSINGPNEETVDNVTTDGNGLLLSGTFEGTFGNFDIYYARKTRDGWGAMEHYPYPINTQYTDEGGYLTSDGKALIFTSDRPGGVGDYHPYGQYWHGSNMGNMDIYVCLRTDSGWSRPINLGPTVNTPYAERAPFLHPDGRTLYFSSNGHPGMGQLDVFKTVRLSDTSWTEWSEPVNLGKEINTIIDDWGYKVGVTGDSAFFAGHWRSDGYGGWDLYTVTMPKETKPGKVVTITGRVIDQHGNPLDAVIKWEDLETGKNVGTLRSSPQDGSYIIVLPYGRNYGYYAEKEGYYPGSESIDLRSLPDISSIRQNITLVSLDEMKKMHTRVRINNLFFDFDKYELKSESRPELDRLAAILEKEPQAQVEIDGYTDNVGTEAYNIELSRRRAEQVYQYLIGRGLDKARLTAKGFGTSSPVAGNDTEEGRARNRRVEVWFVK